MQFVVTVAAWSVSVDHNHMSCKMATSWGASCHVYLGGVKEPYSRHGPRFPTGMGALLKGHTWGRRHR